MPDHCIHVHASHTRAPVAYGALYPVESHQQDCSYAVLAAVGFNSFLSNMPEGTVVTVAKFKEGVCAVLDAALTG